MADVVRRASFVLDFETGDSNIKAPDITPIIRAQKEQLEGVAKIDAATKAGADATADAIRGNLEGLSRLIKAEEITAKAIEDRLNIQASEIEQQSAIDEARKDAHELAVEQIQRQSEVSEEANRKLLRGAQSAAQGVMLATRAVTLLGANSENLRDVIQNLFVIQGAFDLFSGSIRIIQTLTVAMRSFSVASAGAALALNPIAGIVGLLSIAFAGLAISQRKSTAAMREETEAIEMNFRASIKRRNEKEREKREQDRGVVVQSDRLTGGTEENEARRRDQEISRLRRQLRPRAGQSDEDIRFQAEHSQSGRRARQELELLDLGGDKREALEKELEKAKLRRESAERDVDREQSQAFAEGQFDTPELQAAKDTLAETEGEVAEIMKEVAATVASVREVIILFREELDRSLQGAISAQ